MNPPTPISRDAAERSAVSRVFQAGLNALTASIVSGAVYPAAGSPIAAVIADGLWRDERADR